MKILYYSPHPNLNLASPSGYGTHMREMIAAFKNLGHEVKPVIMGGTSLSSCDLTIKSRGPVKKIIASWIPAYVWESAKDYRLLQFDKYAAKVLEKEVEDFQPDFIYERATYLQASGVEVASKFGIKHFLEVNAPYVEERKILQGNSFLINKGIEVEKKLLLGSDRIMVVSSALQEFFSFKYSILSEKFILTPNAVNLECIKVNPKKVCQIKDQLQLNHKLVIGFVGSIFPWHGVDLLIEAFAKLTESTKQEIHLLVVGDGETLSSLKQLADTLNVSQDITFTGNVPHHEVFNYIDAMEICVMAKSNWYGSPVKIFEYGAMGKPVIAPNNGPVRDVLRHKETGLLSEPTVESLSDAINCYLEDNILMVNCAVNFKEKVLSKHTWSINANKVLDFIN